MDVGTSVGCGVGVGVGVGVNVAIGAIVGAKVGIGTCVAIAVGTGATVGIIAKGVGCKVEVGFGTTFGTIGTVDVGSGTTDCSAGLSVESGITFSSALVDCRGETEPNLPDWLASSVLSLFPLLLCSSFEPAVTLSAALSVLVKPVPFSTTRSESEG